jgi:hypothetical protein
MAQGCPGAVDRVAQAASESVAFVALHIRGGPGHRPTRRVRVAIDPKTKTDSKPPGGSCTVATASAAAMRWQDQRTDPELSRQPSRAWPTKHE